MKFNTNNKGIMAIGTLIIFIAVIVVTMIAAGVLLRATGLLSEAGFAVEEEARERLVSGLEVYTVFVFGDPVDGTVDRFEFFSRLRPGSTPIEMGATGISVDSASVSTDAQLNASLIGAENCTFENLEPDVEYCFEDRFGNGNTVLEQGELFIIRYRLSNSSALTTFEEFDALFTPRTGGQEELRLRTPEFILQERVRLR